MLSWAVGHACHANDLAEVGGYPGQISAMDKVLAGAHIPSPLRGLTANRDGRHAGTQGTSNVCKNPEFPLQRKG